MVGFNVGFKFASVRLVILNNVTRSVVVSDAVGEDVGDPVGEDVGEPVNLSSKIRSDSTL